MTEKLIEQILADLTIYEVLINYSLDALGSSLCIECALGVYDNDGAQGTESVASRLNYAYLFIKAVLLDFFF